MGNFRPLSQTKFINDANLVSYWKLDGNSNDSKGSNNGTDTNVSYNSSYAVASNFGQGASFNGSSSKISTGNFSFVNSSSFTVAVWANVNNVSSNRMIFSAGNGVTARLCLQVGINSSLNPFLGFYNDDLTSTGTVSLNTWNFIVATFDYTSKTQTIYINGVQAGTRVATGYLNVDTNSYIGTRVNGSYDNYSGYIDDISIFSRALSAGEVAELYQSMTLGEYLPNSNTKLLLHLNGSSADSSGNGNNGTDTAITYSQANGMFGQGAGFNGSSSYISTPWVVTANGTISTWFKTSQSTAGELWGNEITNHYHRLSISSGKASLYIYENAELVNITTNKTINDNVWHNIVVTWGSGGAKVYVDGDLDVSSANTGYGASSLGLQIGVNNNNGTRTWWFNGAQDELIAESSAWTPQQVAKYYTFTKGRFGL